MFSFDSADHLRIVAETNNKMHVFIFKENNKKQKKNKDIGFTKDEWKTITGREYTNDNTIKFKKYITNLMEAIVEIYDKIYL